MATKRSLEFTGSDDAKKSKMTPKSTFTHTRELSPGDILSPEEHTTVKGIVTSLSPVKRAQSVFLSDGEAIIPLVGFDKTHRQFLHDHMDTETPITLRNCQINTNRMTEKLQIVVKSHTVLEESRDKNLTIQDKNTLGSPARTIGDLCTLEDI